MLAQHGLGQFHRFLALLEHLLEGIEGIEILVAAARHGGMKGDGAGFFVRLHLGIESRHVAFLPRQAGVADEVHVVGLDALAEFLDGLGVGGRGIRLHARQSEPMAVFDDVEGFAATAGGLHAHGERRGGAAHARFVRRLPGLGRRG